MTADQTGPLLTSAVDSPWPHSAHPLSQSSALTDTGDSQEAVRALVFDNLGSVPPVVLAHRSPNFVCWGGRTCSSLLSHSRAQLLRSPSGGGGQLILKSRGGGQGADVSAELLRSPRGGGGRGADVSAGSTVSFQEDRIAHHQTTRSSDTSTEYSKLVMQGKQRLGKRALLKDREARRGVLVEEGWHSEELRQGKVRGARDSAKESE